MLASSHAARAPCPQPVRGEDAPVDAGRGSRGGAEIIIAKNGRPRAKLVAVRDLQRRRPGRAKGQIRMSADFDAPLPKHVLDGFSGGSSD
jgi:antitoxin (DNA-binding transcriptional repressor) of toxin-antitoxin stability system